MTRTAAKTAAGAETTASRLTARLTRCGVVLGLLLAAAACGSGSGGHGEVTVMVPWSGDEFQAFYAAVKQFEGETGITVDVETTRAQTQQLDAAVAAGAPPDLAMLPSAGAIDRYANGPAGSRLRPLDAAVTKDYAQPFRDLGKVGGTVYAVPVKADVKSLIWYDPAVTGSAPPAALSALMARSGPSSTAWCLGLASGPTSGWPGADWIADILLEQDAEDYAAWVSGDLPDGWQSQKIQHAWETWHSLVAGSLGDAAAEQEFASAAGGMFEPTPRCSLAHGALGAMGFPATASPDKPYAFVAPERGRPLEVSADFVGRFTDNPAATKLITWLSSDTGQRAWVHADRSFAISADSRVPATAYRTPVQGRIAAMLQPASGYTLCFSAADAMEPDVSAAFYRAVLDYATGAKVTDLLRGLAAVQNAQDRRKPPVPAGSLCAAPG